MFMLKKNDADVIYLLQTPVFSGSLREYLIGQQKIAAGRGPVDSDREYQYDR